MLREKKELANERWYICASIFGLFRFPSFDDGGKQKKSVPSVNVQKVDDGSRRLCIGRPYRVYAM